MIQGFNNLIGSFVEASGCTLEPRKGMVCANVKSGLYSLATIPLISGIAIAIFSNVATGLAVFGLSFAAKMFIHNAMEQTFFGRMLNKAPQSGFFFKAVMDLNNL